MYKIMLWEIKGSDHDSSWMTETNVEDTRPETSIPGHAPECFFCLDKSTSFVHENFAWDKGFIDAQVPRNTDYVTEEV